MDAFNASSPRLSLYVAIVPLTRAKYGGQIHLSPHIPRRIAIYSALSHHTERYSAFDTPSRHYATTTDSRIPGARSHPLHLDIHLATPRLSLGHRQPADQRHPHVANRDLYTPNRSAGLSPTIISDITTPQGQPPFREHVSTGIAIAQILQGLRMASHCSNVPPVPPFGSIKGEDGHRFWEEEEMDQKNTYTPHSTQCDQYLKQHTFLT